MTCPAVLLNPKYQIKSKREVFQIQLVDLFLVPTSPLRASNGDLTFPGTCRSSLCLTGSHINIWVAETGPWPRELEMIYFVPNTVRPRNPVRVCMPYSEIPSYYTIISESLVLRSPLMIRTKSRVMLPSTRFNSALPHPIPSSPYNCTCNLHVSIRFAELAPTTSNTLNTSL